MGDASIIPPRTCPFDPPELMAELRKREPVSKVTLWDGREAWLITRFEDAYAVMRDRRTSDDSAHPNFPSLSRGRPMPMVTRSFSRMDGQEHKRLRKMVTPTFSESQADRMRPEIQRIVDGQVDHLLATDRPADLVAEFAQPVSITVLSDVLGIPRDDMDFYLKQAETIVSRTEGSDQTGTAHLDMNAGLDALVSEQEREPGDNLIGRLVVNEVRRGTLSHRELVQMINLMIVAGYENPANMMGVGALSMMLDPEWFKAFSAQPERVPDLVEELLRYHTVASHDGAPRVAAEDMTVGGVTIRAGEAMIVYIGSANRDEEVFPDADKLDVNRDVPRHLAFGQGVHMCVGRWLGRAQIQIALSTLAVRIPTLRLAVPVEELPFREDMHSYGVHKLPVTW